MIDYSDITTRRALRFRQRMHDIAKQHNIPNVDTARLHRTSWKLAKLDGGFDDHVLRVVTSLAARGMFD